MSNEPTPAAGAESAEPATAQALPPKETETPPATLSDPDPAIMTDTVRGSGAPQGLQFRGQQPG